MHEGGGVLQLDKYQGSHSIYPPVAAPHMRQLRPGLTCHFGIFFSENEINFMSPYMSVIIRGECLPH